MAQVIPTQNAIFVGLGAKPVAPSQDPWVEVTPASAHAGFQNAIDDLPANGGILYVMPGDAPYEFATQVLVNKPNVVMQFAGGAIVTFAQGAINNALFRVEREGFRSCGLHVVFVIATGNNQPGRSCVLIQANDAALADSTFDITQGLNNIEQFSCIRVIPPVEAGATHKDLKLVRSSFIFGHGVQQSEPWNPDSQGEHRGVCGIRASSLIRVRAQRKQLP